MLRHNKELKAETSVAIKRDYVATIKVVEQEISVVIEKFYVTSENGRNMRPTKESLS